jgi:hypothetical protein
MNERQQQAPASPPVFIAWIRKGQRGRWREAARAGTRQEAADKGHAAAKGYQSYDLAVLPEGRRPDA